MFVCNIGVLNANLWFFFFPLCFFPLFFFPRFFFFLFAKWTNQEIESEFMEQRKAATAAGTTLMTPNELAFDISLAR